MRNRLVHLARQLKRHWVFCFCLLLYTFVTLFLFHWQTVGYNGLYTSDMPSYIAEVQGIDSGFTFPYPIYFWVGKCFALFTTPKHAVAFATVLLNDLAAVVIYLVFVRMFGERNFKFGRCAFLTFALLLVSMAYPLMADYLSGEAHRYLGVFSPNPYHNGTYLAARAFMLLAFFSFSDLLDTKEEKRIRRKGLLFSLWLLLATMTKPSFTLVFGAAALCILLIRLITDRGRNIKQILFLGILFVPTILDLLYQYFGVFIFGDTGSGTAESLGVGIGFATVWGSLTESIPIAVFRGILFPLVIVLCYSDAFRITWYRLSWEVYLAGFLSALLLYEKGYRMMHMNFAWGYMAGMFLLYMTALMVLSMRTPSLQNLKGAKRSDKLRLLAGWSTFCYHLICGIIYFGYLWNGGLFH
ncbi:MAG: hypothetical protein K6A92_04980 [Lachnospiraceae bacterium]|nr:hypothetical protein [Lachnospiraceae bacterium]